MPKYRITIRRDQRENAKPEFPWYGPIMPRYLITIRRDQRENAKPAADAVKGFSGVSIEQVHSPEMVTIDASEAVADKLQNEIGSMYHVEPEIRRGLN
jgi:hypothetical protein